jgi:putative membrane protein
MVGGHAGEMLTDASTIHQRRTYRRRKQGTGKGSAPLYGWERAPPQTNHMLEPILIVAIVIAATAWYVRHRWQKRLRALEIRNPREGTVLELLARRYARGEIDRDEYLQKRSDILDYQAMPPRS